MFDQFIVLRGILSTYQVTAQQDLSWQILSKVA